MKRFLMCIGFMLSFNSFGGQSSGVVTTYVHLPSKPVLSFDFKNSAKLKDLRNRLEDLWKIDGNLLRFSFTGHLIQESDLLSLYKADSSNPILITYLGEPVITSVPRIDFEICFATNRDVMYLSMFPNDKVIDVKRRIQAITGIPISEQKLQQLQTLGVSVLSVKKDLVYEELDDTKLLVSYGWRMKALFSRKNVPDFAKR